MSTIPLPEYAFLAIDVSFIRHAGREWLLVELTDGRAVAVPLALYPTLQRASRTKRTRWRLIGRGDGIHWPGLDYDLSVRGIVHGFAEVTKKPAAKRAKRQQSPTQKRPARAA